MLSELEQKLRSEMPICTAMGIRAASYDDARLAMEMPLGINRNHQSTAFAGSLSALCTVTGWGTVFLELRKRGFTGNVVIRRGSIRYLRPVVSPQIVARASALDPAEVDYFFELLEHKGRSKIEVTVQIVDSEGPLVRFSGSYVVQEYTQAPC